MHKAKILLAEDDLNLGSLLKQYLVAKSYEIDLVFDGDTAYKLFMKNVYDLCILDVMMPKQDGFTLGKNIKRINSKMPIIYLTAKSLKDDVMKGFAIGADDYMTKPFEMEELLVRIEAVLRRTQKDKVKTTKYTIGKFEFDSLKQELLLGDVVAKLTTKENNLLRILSENQNELVERNFVLKEVWGDDSIFNARSMDVYITKLRKYLQEDTSVKIINVHSKGFKLVTDGEE
ncbi:MAG: response regulator transcription factor [Bacteroidales bacterium]|nr:response regulator transcription factor [Bacteroidales bacterium]